ncbi:hypothetical protein D3C79_979460 [compost metagenome]
MRCSLEQCNQQQHIDQQHRAQRRKSQAEQRTDARRTDNAAQTEQAVKPRHHVFATGPFDDHCLQVHRRIHGTQARAEHEQGANQGRNRRYRGQKRQRRTDQQGAAGRHLAATEA